MLTFKQFVAENVKYRPFKPKQMARAEHDETRTQAAAIQRGELETHPAFASALQKFAGKPREFGRALRRSSIEAIGDGTEVGNSDIGSGTDAIQDPEKLKRVTSQLRGNGVDRPIVLRHTDKKTGQKYNHLLAGNTRATAIGYGVQAHHIDV